MKVICSYCEKDMGEKEPLTNKSLTHGICPKCLEEIELEIDMERPVYRAQLRRYLLRLVRRTARSMRHRMIHLAER